MSETELWGKFERKISCVSECKPVIRLGPVRGLQLVQPGTEHSVP